MGSRACCVTVCAMSPCWHSHLGAQFSRGIAVLLLRCDNSQQVFLLLTHKLTPYNICRLFCGQCLIVTTTVKQIGWGDNFITTKLLVMYFLWALKLICKLMSSSCAYNKMSHYLKKKKSFYGMRQWWYLFCIHRGVIDSWVQREQLFALLPVDLVWPRLSSRTIQYHNYLNLPCI